MRNKGILPLLAGRVPTRSTWNQEPPRLWRWPVGQSPSLWRPIHWITLASNLEEEKAEGIWLLFLPSLKRIQKLHVIFPPNTFF